jgi:hypothetical protein
MEFNIKNKLIALACAMLTLTACDQDKDAEPVMDANTKPTITVTRIDEGAGSDAINEGDILEFEVKTSKWMEGAIDFEVQVENLVEHLDYEILAAPSIRPYSSTGNLVIEILSDNFPETAEELTLTVIATDIAQNWRLNPSSLTGTTFDLSVNNINAEGAYSIGYIWGDDHDDYDMYIYSVAEDDFWGGDQVYDAATGNYPETTTALKTSDPDGTYYIGVDPYAVEHETTEYTVSVGLEDGSSQVFTGTLDLNDEEIPMNGGVFNLLKIEKTGTTITVTHLN